MAKRRFDNWIDHFVQYTSSLASPDLLRQWGGIAAIAGVLERKVWIETSMGILYPNLYTVLVAPAGVGKTAVTNTVRNFWAEVDDQYLAPSSVSKASLVDDLYEAERKSKDYHFHSLKILSNELGVLIPGYDNEFMNVLTDLYDCHGYSERKRSSKLNFKIESPQLNILAATTPAYLNNVMPEGAWEQGFISRTLLIYSGQSKLGTLFGGNGLSESKRKDLIFDLNHIARLEGPFRFTDEAAAAITEWYLAHNPPVPDHPRLQHYNTRRTSHVLKLCVVASASAGDDRVITLDHYTQAFDWLIEAEGFMPDIFKAMSSGGDSRVIQEAWHFLYQEHIRRKAPVSAISLVGFVQQRTPAHNVMKIIEVMERGGLIREQIGDGGAKAWLPIKP